MTGGVSEIKGYRNLQPSHIYFKLSRFGVTLCTLRAMRLCVQIPLDVFQCVSRVLSRYFLPQSKTMLPGPELNWQLVQGVTLPSPKDICSWPLCCVPPSVQERQSEKRNECIVIGSLYYEKKSFTASLVLLFVSSPPQFSDVKHILESKILPAGSLWGFLSICLGKVVSLDGGLGSWGWCSISAWWSFPTCHSRNCSRKLRLAK